jgi:hypothetical protein
MQALIPFSLTECLAPREVVVFALRDFLTSRTGAKPMQEAQAATAAKPT